MQNIELFSKLSVPMFQTLFLHSRFYFPFEKFLSNMSNAKVVRDILVRAGDSEFMLYQQVSQQTSATSSTQYLYDCKQVASISQHLLKEANQGVNDLEYGRHLALYLAHLRNDHSQAQEQQKTWQLRPLHGAVPRAKVFNY